MKTERLNEVIRYLIFKNEAASNVELANILGYTQSGFSQITTGRVNVSTPLIRKITQRFPYINGEWIMSGKGDMLIEHCAPSEPASQKREIDEDVLDLMKSQQKTIISQQESISKLVDKLTSVSTSIKKGTEQVS